MNIAPYKGAIKAKKVLDCWGSWVDWCHDEVQYVAEYCSLKHFLHSPISPNHKKLIKRNTWSVYTVHLYTQKRLYLHL